MAGSRLMVAFAVLHCDKLSRFCHIEAPTVRFVVRALIVSGDNGLKRSGGFPKNSLLCCSKVRTSEAGTSGRMLVDRTKRSLISAALLASALALGGCSSSIADLPLIGTPADAPGRPKDASTYLPVHDLPPEREEAALPPAERAKIEAELAAARDRQASVAAAQNPAAQNPAAK
jgi:hypothetical protein